MSETLEKRIKRMGQNVDTSFTAYASDVLQILTDKEGRNSDAEETIEKYQIALSIALAILEDKYDYEEHCACSYSGSGGTVSQCDFHKAKSIAENSRFEYEKHWKNFHRG